MTLQPDGYQPKCTDLQSPLAKDDKVDGMLTSKTVGTVPVGFTVEGVATQSPNAGQHENKY